MLRTDPSYGTVAGASIRTLLPCSTRRFAWPPGDRALPTTCLFLPVFAWPSAMLCRSARVAPVFAAARAPRLGRRAVVVRLAACVGRPEGTASLRTKIVLSAASCVGRESLLASSDFARYDVSLMRKIFVNRRRREPREASFTRRPWAPTRRGGVFALLCDAAAGRAQHRAPRQGSCRVRGSGIQRYVSEGT